MDNTIINQIQQSCKTACRVPWTTNPPTRTDAHQHQPCKTPYGTPHGSQHHRNSTCTAHRTHCHPPQRHTPPNPSKPCDPTSHQAASHHPNGHTPDEQWGRGEAKRRYPQRQAPHTAQTRHHHTPCQAPPWRSTTWPDRPTGSRHRNQNASGSDDAYSLSCTGEWPGSRKCRHQTEQDSSR